MSGNVIKEQVRANHPCFGYARNKGRIHLPVCPACNIECKFCDRRINTYEDRPGVTGELLSPQEAVDALGRALEICPDITVAGIAGPGDTLATNGAIETFRLIRERYPNILKCMSTNGLLLNERAQELIDLGIDTLTVTVNAVDPVIQAKIISGIYYHGKRYEGEEAAKILIENQLAGIRKMAQAGVTIKVNTVLIMEINRGHIREIAKAVSEAGATMYNIIPLIPQHQFKDFEEPKCVDIDGARREAEEFIDVFRHCQRCRADAVGIPGQKDYGDQIYLKRLNPKETFSHG
ncbi:MAG: radical SAM protein [Lachnospiraceae bacterium]|nr:radical SAM protein [Lachnospiraceae bacterium]